MTELSIRSWIGVLTPGRGARRAAGTTVVATLLRFWLIVPLALAAWVVAADVDLALVRPASALFLMLGAPTLLLHRRADFLSDTAVTRLLGSFGYSLLALIVVGLLLNVALPVVGIDRPLAPVPLALTWLALNTALLAWRSEVPVLPSIAWSVGRRALLARFEWAQALAAGSVLVAVLGAIRLNNGAGGAFAWTGQALAAAALVALMVRPAGTLGRDARCLALVAGSLLLATSLRGWFITGHDIQAEFLAFQLTNADQRWQMSDLENAYNACLSVNILPTLLVQATGFSGEVVFKVLLQMVFALVPVLTYLFSRRFLSRRPALVAAAFTMAFPTFFTDMPYLVRQEMAFFFLALLLVVATERPVSRQRIALVALLGVGVILSHYSTTYLMLMGLVFALVALAVWRVVGPRLGRERDTTNPFRLVLLHPFLVAFLVAASLTWAGPITGTGGHAGEVARESIAALFGKKADTPGSSDLSYSLFGSQDVSPRERMNSFVDETMQARQDIPREALLVKKPGKPMLRPALVPTSTADLTPVGEFLQERGIDPESAHVAARVAAAAVMQVLLIVGLLGLLRRRRPEHRLSAEVAYLSIGAVGAMGLLVVVPNLSVDYGVLRAFQQTMLVVAPLMAAGLWLLVRPLRSVGTRLAIAVPVVLLLVLGGVLPALVGGQQERMALADSGNYYDRFFASESEIQAMAWVAAAEREDPRRSRIIANRNVGVRLLAETDNRAAIADRLYPTLLTRDGYVYVDGQIAGKGRSTIFYSGDLLTYVYPMKVLDRHRDLVYSSPRSRIYR